MLLTASWVTSRNILLVTTASMYKFLSKSALMLLQHQERPGQPFKNMFAQRDSALGHQLYLQAC